MFINRSLDEYKLLQYSISIIIRAISRFVKMFNINRGFFLDIIYTKDPTLRIGETIKLGSSCVRPYVALHTHRN